ncbi:MAG: exo-1,3-beta-glucanase [Chaenotheca gracillima]|nr:MAG: exo-1,3-beta-glucanase [Chaenotheca gracillima]
MATAVLFLALNESFPVTPEGEASKSIFSPTWHEVLKSVFDDPGVQEAWIGEEVGSQAKRFQLVSTHYPSSLLFHLPLQIYGGLLDLATTKGCNSIETALVLRSTLSDPSAVQTAAPGEVKGALKPPPRSPKDETPFTRAARLLKPLLDEHQAHPQSSPSNNEDERTNRSGLVISGPMKPVSNFPTAPELCETLTLVNSEEAVRDIKQKGEERPPCLASGRWRAVISEGMPGPNNAGWQDAPVRDISSAWVEPLDMPASETPANSEGSKAQTRTLLFFINWKDEASRATYLAQEGVRVLLYRWANQERGLTWEDDYAAFLGVHTTIGHQDRFYYVHPVRRHQLEREDAERRKRARLCQIL